MQPRKDCDNVRDFMDVFENQIFMATSDAWRYREALRLSCSYLMENYEPLTVGDLLTRMFSRGHLKQGDYQYINETHHTRDKIRQLLNFLIESEEIDMKRAFDDLIDKLSEDEQRSDIPTTLIKNYEEAINWTRRTSEENVNSLVSRLHDDVMIRTNMEILQQVGTIENKMDYTKHKTKGPSERSLNLPSLDSEDTELMNACAQGNVDQVRSLIESTQGPALINVKNKQGQTALMIACKKDNRHVVRLLVRSTTITVNAQDLNSCSAFMYAVMNGNVDIVEVLLSNGDVDVNAKDKSGLSAAWYLYGEQIILQLTDHVCMHTFVRDLRNMSKIIIDNVRDIHETLNWEAITQVVRKLLTNRKMNRNELLQAALLLGQETIVSEILKYGIIEINVSECIGYVLKGVRPQMFKTLVECSAINFSRLPDSEVNEIMKFVIQTNDTEICIAMLKFLNFVSDVNPLKIALTIQTIDKHLAYNILKDYKVGKFNMTDAHGNSVFMTLCKYASTELVSTLLRLDAINFHARNKDGKTAFMLSCDNISRDVPKLVMQSGKFPVHDYDAEGCTNIMYACRADCHDLVEFLLRHGGTEVNARNKRGSTLLIMACKFSSSDIVASLLKLETMDVNASNHRGHTALIIACWRGDIDIVSLLLKVAGVNVNAENLVGDTALIAACKLGTVDTVKLLLDMSDIQVNTRNRYGHTALLYACGASQTEIIRLLLSNNNVNINEKDEYDRTVLMSACRRGDVDVVAELLRSDKIDVTITDGNGNSAFKFAAISGGAKITRFLIDWIDNDSKTKKRDNVEGVV